MIRNLLFAFLLFTACKQTKPKVWSDMSAVQKLAEFKQTGFVPTLENPISGDDNIIYAPSMLYAWAELNKQLKWNIYAEKHNSPDFKLMTESSTFKNSLDEGEYLTDVKVADEEITIKVFFKSTLPFETKLQQNQPILFGKTKVEAFGMESYADSIANISQVLYYKDDNKFVLKLYPKDKKHEVVLVKGLDDMPNLWAAVKATDFLIEQGEKERGDAHQQWKYVIRPEDMFSIPVIQFNIATNYDQLEGQTFRVNGIPHLITTAYQRTGFILNEAGAVVESEAIIVDSAAAAIDEEPVVVIPPKRMILDKPFYIIVRSVIKPFPYFVMKVDNPELMIKK